MVLLNPHVLDTHVLLLTQRFCSELKRVEQFGEESISVDTLFESLRINSSLSIPKPRLLNLGGIKPIILIHYTPDQEAVSALVLTITIAAADSAEF